MDAAEYESLRPLINSAVAEVHKYFGQWVELDDLTGTAWLWCFENRLLVEKLLDDERTDRLRLLFRDAATEHAAREKATRSGYSLDDQISYPPRLLRDLLPDVFDVEDWQSFGSHGDGQPRAQGLKNATGDRLASILDIRRALPTLTQKQYDVLMWTYRLNYSDRIIAEEMGTTEGTVRKARSRALRALSKALSTETSMAGYEARTAAERASDGRTGTRPVHSIASSINRTDREYEGA